MTRYLRLSAGLIGLLVLAGAAALFVGQDAKAQQSFFDPCGSTAVEETTANTPSNITGNFGLGVGADCVPLTSDDVPNAYNSGGLIYFTPPGWTVAKDSDIPDGTKVGSFGSRAILGLLNNACNTVLGVPFDLLDGTTNRSNTIVADVPGTPNRLNSITLDTNPANGIPDAADKWPTFLDAVGERVGIDMSKLVARFIGINKGSVSGTTVVLNFLVFEPGTHISNLINLDPRLGYPAVTVLQDPSAAASDFDPVSDFCAPLYTELTVFGEAGGATFRGNPGNGQYNFVTYVASAPDEDLDGIENGLDPCPETPSTDWDPRATKFVGMPGDTDADGIPNVCDPHPTEPSLGVAGSGIAEADEDLDKWQNRGDNCPLDSNPLQEDKDGDGMGDACDPNIDVRSPSQVKCLISPVTIGSGGAAADDPNTMAPCDPTAQVPSDAGTPTPVGQTPTPLPSGVTPRPSGASGGGTGVGGAGSAGIGTLSPAGVEIPIWAAVFAAVGLVGLLGGFTMVGSHLRRRR